MIKTLEIDGRIVTVYPKTIEINGNIVVAPGQVVVKAVPEADGGNALSDPPAYAVVASQVDEVADTPG